MEGQNVVVKKIKRKGHEGAHGGSWKVAYADFVTAMMAFFLLLWLISMVAPEKKARVSQYFKTFSVFEKSGTSPMDFTAHMSPQIVGDEGPQPGVEEGHTGDNEIIGDNGGGESLAEALKREVETQLPTAKDQVKIGSFEGGVRIELTEGGKNPMFALGSAELSPIAKSALKVLAERIRLSGDRFAIEGHTDAKVFPSNLNGNWELSTERASSAKKELENNSVPCDRLVRIAGYASTQPLVKEDPYDPRNRRITILLFNDNERPASDSLSIPKDQPGSTKRNSKERFTQADVIGQYLMKRSEDAILGRDPSAYPGRR